MRRGIGGFAYLIAADISSGAYIWGTQVDPHIAATVTQSPTIYKASNAVD
jgi:hypothetical protein